MQSTRSRFSRQSTLEAGFTVAELVVASVILFVVLMGIVGAVQYAGASTQMVSMRQGAIDVATQQIEWDRNLPWSQFGVVYANGDMGSPTGTIPATGTVVTARGTYSVLTSVWWNMDRTHTIPINSDKQIRVTVSWTSPTAGSVTVESASYGLGPTSNLGLVQVTCVDADNPALMVPGADVILDPPGGGANMHAASGNDGVAIWTSVPTGAGAYFYSGINPNMLVDVSGLTSPTTIIAGYQNCGFVYCQKPSTATIHVHTSSITNYAGAKVTLVDNDRGLTYVGYTDSSGYVTFSSANNNVNNLAGLWKSKGAGYKAQASAGSAVSTWGTFSISTGGQAYTGLDLALPDPPSITVSKKIATTGAALNGTAWTLVLKNPSGTVIGNYAGSADSVTFPISGAGNYTASVTNVAGFLDNTTFTFAASAAGVNQACVVPMSPLFLVGVRVGGVGRAGAQVTMTNATTGVSVASTSGANPGVTGAAGTVGFIIPADGNYNVSAVYNGVTYNGTQVSLVAASPPTTPYYIDIKLGGLSATTVVSGTRSIALYDASNTLVATGTVSVAAPIELFSVPGGMYTITVGGTLSPGWSTWPTTLPANTASKYKDTALTAPGVPTDGSTYVITGVPAAN